MSGRKNLKAVLAGGAGALALMTAGMAAAQTRDYDVPAGDLIVALDAYARQSGVQIIYKIADISGVRTGGARGALSDDEALGRLLEGTNFEVRRDPSGAIAIAQAGSGSGPQSASAAGEVEALIVTAQKREEDIQDVPIAISAFTQEDLTRSQVAGGPDLITQVPNMTFTKTNFSSYSVQLRGIGTQAISATTDPAVAVAFNNTPFIRNRFFEQEFYDLQRVEVLRGPQGTLYGRNATAGVVNIISQKPRFTAEAKLSGDVSNYNSSRLEGMINIPLVDDRVALRLAGAWTKRDGYATNEISGNPIDGRDLWSTRLSLRVSPNDRLDANLIWEHFEEDDDRLRSGKQLCKKHVVPDVGGLPVQAEFGGFSGFQAMLSQGCIRTSLYSPEAFQTPNGYAVPYYHPLGALSLPTVAEFDPYRNQVQSRDLRVIESTVDPDYRAKADLAELQASFDVTDTLTLTSETAYSVDTVYSMQDFNRFNTAPGAWDTLGSDGHISPVVLAGILDENGVFCDPQIGCSDRLVAVDISTAKASQFSQEFRISSNFDGAFNFSLGANFLRADSEDKYYVFINALTMFAAIEGFSGIGGSDSYGEPYQVGLSDNLQCLKNGTTSGDPRVVFPVEDCIYIDPNPIGNLNDQGHNYFLSKNPYKLISYAVFGEAYYNITDALKVTAGLRWTVDKKEAPRVPSWTLAGQSYGHPVAEVVEQEWREPTGRLTFDWKPDVAVTDETMLYASYAHGYKAGGANPPRYVYVSRGEAQSSQIAAQESETRPKVFAAEFVDAFEIGAKNVLADGKVTANLAAFYYDYKDYQISEIVDRSAFNRNFDATVWGVEIEADWRPLENLKLGFKGGYEKTRIADGERAVDLMDRTAGRPDWVVVRPFPTFASSCILPTHLFAHDGQVFPVGNQSGGNDGGCELAYILGLDPITGEEYVPNPPQPNAGWHWPNGGLGMVYVNYPGFDPHQPEINNGEGFLKDISGNELPNAPNWTGTITADYTLPLPAEWLATLHADLHWQSESWWRLFQDHEYAKLDEYFTMNLAAIFANEDRGWSIMAYIKNVTDETAITGAFLNSDDTGLTTNVFLTEPRLYGLRVTKAWAGASLLDDFGVLHQGPFPLTVEIGGQVQRHDAPSDAIQPTFASALPSALDVVADAQQADLDWGDGREIRLVWRPRNEPWTVAAAARFGKTNGASRLTATEESEEACAGAGPDVFFCVYYPHDVVYKSETNWSNVHATLYEEHTIVDFAVGHDLGIGALSHSSVAAGLRYAQLNARAGMEIDTIPDWYLPEGWLFPKYNYATHTLYSGSITADRSFEGIGPSLSWEGAVKLLGNKDSGHLTLGGSVGAAVLFGKQEVGIRGIEEASTYEATGLQVFAHYTTPPLTVTETVIHRHRTKDVTVPTFAAALGLSYEIDRVRIGAGYRWERYFDAIDGGFAEHQDADRTIDGPYFKISVGFGG